MGGRERILPWKETKSAAPIRRTLVSSVITVPGSARYGEPASVNIAVGRLDGQSRTVPRTVAPFEQGCADFRC